jgi:hypothetical protein
MQLKCALPNVDVLLSGVTWIQRYVDWPDNRYQQHPAPHGLSTAHQGTKLLLEHVLYKN